MDVCKKQKNYPPSGLTPEQAKVEYDRLSADADAITDNAGHHGDPFRCAIEIETLAIDREALIREQGYELQDLQRSVCPRWFTIL